MGALDVGRNLQFFSEASRHQPCPIGSMYGIFTYIYHKNQPNVGKYTIDGMGVTIHFLYLPLPEFQPKTSNKLTPGENQELR